MVVLKNGRKVKVRQIRCASKYDTQGLIGITYTSHASRSLITIYSLCFVLETVFSSPEPKAHKVSL